MRPPRVAERLLARLLPTAERTEVLGDLAERYRARRESGGSRTTARLWYWRQAVVLPVWLWGAKLKSLDLASLEIGPVLRRLARSPGFTVVAVASLGLGIGANTAIFSALRSLLYTPLDVERPDELRLVYHTRPDEFGSVSQFGSSQTSDPRDGATIHSNVPYAAFGALRRAATPAVELLGYSFPGRVTVVADDRPALSAGALLASGDYFTTLGLPTVVGRPLVPDDDRPEAPPVAVISHSFWQRAFGGDPSAVGRIVQVGGEPVQIVGVSRPGFDGLSPGGFFPSTEITFPLSAQPVVVPRWTPSDGTMFSSPDRYWVRVMARVPAEGSGESARQAMTAALGQAFLETGVIEPDQEARVEVRLLEGARGLDALRRQTEGPLEILAAVVAIVLLVACANVASLLLARGASRRREMVVRGSLGASRLQLAWPLLLESLLVAALGAGLGVALAWWGGTLVAAGLTAGLGARVEIEMDATLLVMTAAVALGAALLSGLFPALRASSAGSGDSLGTRGESAGRSRAARILMVVQIAISMPLVVGAGLLVGTVANLDAVELGFDPAGLSIFEVDPSAVAADPDEAVTVLEQVVDGVAGLPGVESASVVENVLLSGWISNTRVAVDGEEVSMEMNAVGPGFFETFGIPVLSGRGLEETDDAGSSRVVVVNETASQRFFGGRALGRTFGRADDPEYRVVGVVGDALYASIRGEVQPAFYDSYKQRRPFRTVHVAVRAPTAGSAMESAIREAVARVHPGLAVTGFRSQAEQIETAVGRERIFARLLGLFGAFALFLACIGLHGITAFSVSRRTAEMGVRMALGARPENVLGLVLRQVIVLSAVGLGLGLVAAWVTAPVLESLLFGLEPGDPRVMLGAAASLLSVALLAGWLPARRAARTDPLKALAPE